MLPLHVRVAAPQSCQLGLSKTGHIVSISRIGALKPKTLQRILEPDDYTTCVRMD